MILATLSLFLILLHSNENDANDIEKVLIVSNLKNLFNSAISATPTSVLLFKLCSSSSLQAVSFNV